MKDLKVDYVSDLHLSFYLKCYEKGYNKRDMEIFVEEKIRSQVQGEILVIAGDISEYVESAVSFLEMCSRHYEKVFFVAGNHEYYLSRIMAPEVREEFNGRSFNKIVKIRELDQDSDKIEFLDSSCQNQGIAEYKGFTIAGDTMWYVPKSLKDWFFYYVLSNDSRLIRSERSAKERIEKLNLYSSCWYECLPENVDLIISHIPPTSNPKSKHQNNACYNNDLKNFKSKTWIYGHDHTEADFYKEGTRFVSNPWGYDSKDFKIKTLTLKK